MRRSFSDVLYPENKPKLDNLVSDYRYQPPAPADELLAELWSLKKDTSAVLKGLTR